MKLFEIFKNLLNKEDDREVQLVDQDFAASCLPALEEDANKYTRGLVELVVGSDRFLGAALLACQAANVAGAGYVRAYVPANAAQALLAMQPSAVACGQEEFAWHTHEGSEHHPLAVVVGCGMSGSQAENDLVIDVLKETKASVLVDGSGLSALARQEGLQALQARAEEGLATVITPHGGEAYRLVKAHAPEQAEAFRTGALPPYDAAELLARTMGVTCVLKGPDTFIVHQGQLFVMCEGTAALAKAGTGDILAGLIGSLLAQGASVADACAAGTFIHARAGGLAAGRCGMRCVTAEDVLGHIAPAVCSLEG